MHHELQKYVIDRVLEDDGITGDQYGSFAPEHIKEERQRLKQERVSLYLACCLRVVSSAAAMITVYSCYSHQGILCHLQARAKARRQAEKDRLAQQADKKKAQARSQISAAGEKAKKTVQQARPRADPTDSSSESDSDSSSESSSDDESSSSSSDSD